jgi:FkbH-like protein
LLISAVKLFPTEVSWGAKSEAVKRIIRAWNIGPDSVVFIDDSPMEVAEVASSFPQMECRVFPADNERKLGELLEELRNLFGKSAISEEDRIRTDSLRAADQMAAAIAETTPDEFLARVDANITLHIDQPDQRSFELINKTNQFNLNGKRLGETHWKSRLEDHRHFLATVAYQDKFGPLGIISVVSGYRRDDSLLVDVWVMSCRAFSRRIEYHVLSELFARFGVKSIYLDYLPTERNGPLREFLTQVAKTEPQPSMCITKAVFQETCPSLYAKVNER